MPGRPPLPLPLARTPARRPAVRAAVGVAVAVAALLGVVGGRAAPAEGPPKLKVGVILPMTGDQATYGEESWNGIQLALSELTKAGGLPVTLELLLKDETSNKQQAGTQAKSLIETSGVHVLVGSVASSNTKQIFQEAKEAEVPCISPASTNDTLTREAGPYCSRICFSDSFQGSVLADFALSRGWKKAAAVVDKSQAYSLGLAKNFRQAFEAKGGRVSEDYYVGTDTDFANVIQNVANQNPDVIFLSGYYGQAGPMIKQSKGKWDGKPIIGGDGLDSPDFVKLAGGAGVETYMTSHFAADAPDPAVQAFAKAYTERFGKPPGAMAALGYDVLHVLVDAARRASPPTDPEALARAIASTKGLKLVTGTVDLSTPDRTPVKDVVIVKVEPSGLKYHATIPAAGQR